MAWLNTSVLAPWLTVALCACSTSMSFGRKINTAHISDIRPCVTTDESLLAWFGEPYRVGNENGLETLQWFYLHVKAKFGSSESESQSLVVVLNRAGKVVHFQLNPTCPEPEVKDVCESAEDAPTR
jgi:hypothetical protein